MESTKQVLPENFNGVFPFTNFTQDEFKARWGGIEYTFPPLSTTPMIIPTATPMEIQSIRKKFAKELAEREFYKSENLKKLEQMNPMHTINTLNAAVTYNPQDLEPYVQRCLEPLPEARATVKVVKSEDENKLRKDAKGRNISKVVSQAEGDSLIGNATLIPE